MRSPAAILTGIFTLVLTVGAQADDVIWVTFPEGGRQHCSESVIGRFTVTGPARVSVRTTINPYMSLGYHPNIPVSNRSTWWANKEDFAYASPLPGALPRKSTQGGKETGDWVDGVPLILEDTYVIEESESFTVDVRGNPQCWPVSHVDYDYWQEGQELRVEVFGAEVVAIDGNGNGEVQQLDLNGGWNTDYGAVILWQDGATVTGTYMPDENGKIEAALDGNGLTGFWSETRSDKECATERLGSRYWGRIRWTFSPRAFEGTYGYCDDKPALPWNGRRP
ncbi:MAG: hypothetical protein F9K19_23855 [Rhizobiaceae bacterium]|nr:MAG: hypothetical protein F9K19_23855 [Rhizobiaceae bacterium]CAG0994538.1 hypothetical protein RHIZO_02437 [Rhizobiaceae bacterium]